MWLSSYDIAVLQSLIRGERWDIGSCHRVRLEPVGLRIDGANGLCLTVDGVKASSATATCQPESSVASLCAGSTASAVADLQWDIRTTCRQ
jgi:hypothetical protein